MFITREADYALRILRGLRDGEMYTLGELSQREHVPLSFAYKIAKKLERTGFVELNRGASGGCRLTSDLRRVSLYDLMAAVGENTTISECMTEGAGCAYRDSHGKCAVHDNLVKIQARLDQDLKSNSLWDIMSEGR